jgi:pseudouridine-5'-phosphate glycosidase
VIVVQEAVRAALMAGRPVVAMESTIYSTLGLPVPHNAEALQRCKAAVTAGGAVPAVTAVVDGQWRIGLTEGEEERVLAGTRKVAERDLAVAAAQRWDVGVTTVSASVALAARAGISVFATGGIGGVHRGAELSGDVSADLDALANHPVVTVCAGAKSFLDLPRTLELLETAGVPVWAGGTRTSRPSTSAPAACPSRTSCRPRRRWHGCCARGHDRRPACCSPCRSRRPTSWTRRATTRRSPPRWTPLTAPASPVRR